MADIVANTEELDQLIQSWIPQPAQKQDNAHHALSSTPTHTHSSVSAHTATAHTTHRLGIGVSQEDASEYIKQSIADKKLRAQLKLSTGKRKRKHGDDDSDGQSDTE